MPISAVCPSCQAKLKVPDQMENKKGKCPKCQNVILFNRFEEASNPPFIQDAPLSAPSVPVIIPKVYRKVVEQPPAPEDDFMQNSDQAFTQNVISQRVIVNHKKNSSNSLGIASLVVAVLSFFICWLPGVGVLVSGLALFLGLVGIVVSFLRKGEGIGYPIAGAGLAAISLTLSFVWTTAVLTPAINKVIAASEKVKTENAAKGVAKDVKQNANNQMPGEEAAKEPAKEPAKAENDLVDAVSKVAVVGDVKVKIISAEIDFVTGKTFNEFKSEEKLLKITVRITNANPNKKVEFEGWGKHDFSFDDSPSLKDNFKNSYKLINFGIGARVDGQVRIESLYPDKPLTDLLVFEAPLGNMEYLVLELPNKNIGGKGSLKFKIPSSMLRK